MRKRKAIDNLAIATAIGVCDWPTINIGFSKRGLLETGSSQKSPFSKDSREFRDSREPPDRGNKEESDHFLEILMFVEILEILAVMPIKRPLSQ